MRAEPAVNALPRVASLGFRRGTAVIDLPNSPELVISSMPCQAGIITTCNPYTAKKSSASFSRTPGPKAS
jgi:hypothetical protein